MSVSLKDRNEGLFIYFYVKLSKIYKCISAKQIEAGLRFL
jgi:hypothetical protein